MLLQSYDFDVNEKTVSIPISVYGATEDTSVPCQTLRDWKNFTISNFSLETLSGDHFFLHKSKEFLVQSYLRKITAKLQKKRQLPCSMI